MPYRFFKDSRGHSHEVLIQEESNSCGVACAAMIENIVKKTRGYNETTLIEKSSELGLEGWSQSHGAYLSNLGRLLRDEGVPNHGHRFLDPNAMWTVVDSYVGRGRPVMLVVWWPNGTTHAVLAAKLHRKSNTVVIYDPACGVVETKLDKLTTYKANYNGYKCQGLLTGHFLPVI